MTQILLILILCYQMELNKRLQIFAFQFNML